MLTANGKLLCLAGFSIAATAGRQEVLPVVSKPEIARMFDRLSLLVLRQRLCLFCLPLLFIRDRSFWAEMLRVAGPLLMRMALWISIGLLLLGGIDYAWQRWKYESALCMTPDDWRDDIKSVHNDVSSLRRRRAFQKSDEVE